MGFRLFGISKKEKGEDCPGVLKTVFFKNNTGNLWPRRWVG